MEGASRHIIRRASVDLQYYGKTDGLGLQQELSVWCTNVLGTSLELALKEYDHLEDTIKINSITLDIQVDKGQDWKKSLAENIILLFRDNMHHLMSGASGNLKITTEHANFTAKLSHYLKFGILPWNVPQGTIEYIKENLRTWLQKLESGELEEFLYEHSDRGPISRFIKLLNESDFKGIFGLLAGEKTDPAMFLKDLMKIIDSMTGDREAQVRLMEQYKVELISGLSRKSAPGLYDIMRNWLMDILHEKNLDLQDLDTTGLILSESRDLIAELQKMPAASLEPDQIKQKDKPGDSDLPDRPEIGSNDLLAKTLEEGVLINNAGTVIIAPFLPVLFAETGLVRDNRITDVSMALAVIHYCITGSLEAQEFELLLPKILCGVEPAFMPLLPIVTDEQILAEADSMLSSVIEHWSILQDSSIEGLREAFLQRNGKLSFIEDEWIVLVEQKSYDVLLDRLPWNIRMIKLPWMKNILMTHWV